MIRITLFGAAGRMGGAILNVLPSFKEIVLAHAVESPGHPQEGKKIYKNVKLECDHSRVLQDTDVAVDFTGAESSVTNLKFAASAGKPIVIGVTGHDPDQKAHILAASKAIPVALSPNMSVGVNTMWKLIEDACSIMGKDFKIEIVETHHIHKKDSPSGTAKKMMQIAEESGLKTTVRSIREGEVIGDHTITFKGPYETLEITHRAISREVFAAGALKAALWIAGKGPGLYEMKDVLGIK